MFSQTETNYALACGLVAIACGVLAHFNEDWDTGLRLGLALVCAVFALVFFFWALDVLRYLIGKLRFDYNYPMIRMLQVIRDMTPEQLAVAKQGGLVTVELVPSTVGLLHKYQTPTIPLTKEEVAEQFHICITDEKYPQLPLQSGRPDDGPRRRMAAFTHLCEMLNLAHRPNGPKRPAVWKASAKEIQERLEI